MVVRTTSSSKCVCLTADGHRQHISTYIHTYASLCLHCVYIYSILFIQLHIQLLVQQSSTSSQMCGAGGRWWWLLSGGGTVDRSRHFPEIQVVPVTPMHYPLLKHYTYACIRNRTYMHTPKKLTSFR